MRCARALRLGGRPDPPTYPESSPLVQPDHPNNGNHPDIPPPEVARDRKPPRQWAGSEEELLRLLAEGKDCDLLNLIEENEYDWEPQLGLGEGWHCPGYPPLGLVKHYPMCEKHSNQDNAAMATGPAECSHGNGPLHAGNGLVVNLPSTTSLAHWKRMEKLSQ